MTLEFSMFGGFTSVLHDIDEKKGTVGSGPEAVATGAGTDWLGHISKNWIGDPYQESYVVPLAKLVEKMAHLSGTPVPEIDESETLGEFVRVGGLE